MFADTRIAPNGKIDELRSPQSCTQLNSDQGSKGPTEVQMMRLGIGLNVRGQGLNLGVATFLVM